MAERPISLSKHRKARARKDDRARADENALKFGRSKAQRDLIKARAAKASADLDGKKRDP